jgi:outer membrane biosynthesis protein TonB
MQQIARKMWGDTGWGMPTSLALHLALAFLLLVRLPEQSPPAKEQSINVELVSPPLKREEKPPEERSEPKQEQARRQPQAFESASARVDKEKPPQSQLPPAAPKAAENPRPATEQSRPSPAKTEKAAADQQPETKTAIAELRSESKDAINGAANAAARAAAPVPEEKPIPEEAKAANTQESEEVRSERASLE